jgi:hypothetical protein
MRLKQGGSPVLKTQQAFKVADSSTLEYIAALVWGAEQSGFTTSRVRLLRDDHQRASGGDRPGGQDHYAQNRADSALGDRGRGLVDQVNDRAGL